MDTKSPRRGAWPFWVLVAPLMIVGVASARWIGSSLPTCLFHQQTGLHCPGCGATRAALALGEGKVGVALQNNFLFVFWVLFGGAWIVLSATRERFPEVKWLRPFQWRLWFLWAILAALFVFTLLRNVSGFEWNGTNFRQG